MQPFSRFCRPFSDIPRYPKEQSHVCSLVLLPIVRQFLGRTGPSLLIEQPVPPESRSQWLPSWYLQPRQNRENQRRQSWHFDKSPKVLRKRSMQRPVPLLPVPVETPAQKPQEKVDWWSAVHLFRPTFHKTVCD